MENRQLLDMLELKMIEDEAEKHLGGVSRYNQAEAHHGADALSQQNRYLDARLEGIEGRLDARMEAMQRYQEQADSRMEQSRKESEARFSAWNQAAEARFEKAEQRIDDRVGEVLQEMRETRRHVSVMSATTIGVTVGSVIAALAVAVTLMASQINEQGAWLRQSVERIEASIEQRSAPAVSDPEPQASPDDT